MDNHAIIQKQSLMPGQIKYFFGA